MATTTKTFLYANLLADLWPSISETGARDEGAKSIAKKSYRCVLSSDSNKLGAFQLVLGEGNRARFITQAPSAYRGGFRHLNHKINALAQGLLKTSWAVHKKSAVTQLEKNAIEELKVNLEMILKFHFRVRDAAVQEISDLYFNATTPKSTTKHADMSSARLKVMDTWLIQERYCGIHNPVTVEGSFSVKKNIKKDPLMISDWNNWAAADVVTKALYGTIPEDGTAPIEDICMDGGREVASQIENMCAKGMQMLEREHHLEFAQTSKSGRPVLKRAFENEEAPQKKKRVLRSKATIESGKGDIEVDSTPKPRARLPTTKSPNMRGGCSKDSEIVKHDEGLIVFSTEKGRAGENSEENGKMVFPGKGQYQDKSEMDQRKERGNGGENIEGEKLEEWEKNQGEFEEEEEEKELMGKEKGRNGQQEAERRYLYRKEKCNEGQTQKRYKKKAIEMEKPEGDEQGRQGSWRNKETIIQGRHESDTLQRKPVCNQAQDVDPIFPIPRGPNYMPLKTSLISETEGCGSDKEIESSPTETDQVYKGVDADVGGEDDVAAGSDVFGSEQVNSPAPALGLLPSSENEQTAQPSLLSSIKVSRVGPPITQCEDAMPVSDRTDEDESNGDLFPYVQSTDESRHPRSDEDAPQLNIQPLTKVKRRSCRTRPIVLLETSDDEEERTIIKTFNYKKIIITPVKARVSSSSQSEETLPAVHKAPSSHLEKNPNLRSSHTEKGVKFFNARLEFDAQADFLLKNLCGAVGSLVKKIRTQPDKSKQCGYIRAFASLFEIAFQNETETWERLETIRRNPIFSNQTMPNIQYITTIIAEGLEARPSYFKHEFLQETWVPIVSIINGRAKNWIDAASWNEKST